MLPVKLGEEIEIEGRVLKIGRNIAFAEAEFRRKSDSRVVAKGKHTIAFIPNPPTVNGEPFEQFWLVVMYDLMGILVFLLLHP